MLSGFLDAPADRPLRRLHGGAGRATCRSTTSGFRWAGRGDWKWTVAPVDPAWLPELVPPTERLGELSPAAAAHTGSRRACRSSPRPPTRRARSSGPAPSTTDVAGLSYGTTATANVTSARYVEPIPLIPPFPAAIPGSWNARDPGLPRLLDGRVVQARVRRPRGRRRPRRAGSPRRSLFDDLVRSVPPGSMGLMLQPYWSPGRAHPGPGGQGAIIGFGDVHTRAHLYRAILEGLAYALRDGAERTAKRTGVPLDDDCGSRAAGRRARRPSS